MERLDSEISRNVHTFVIRIVSFKSKCHFSGQILKYNSYYSGYQNTDSLRFAAVLLQTKKNHGSNGSESKPSRVSRVKEKTITGRAGHRHFARAGSGRVKSKILRAGSGRVKEASKKPRVGSSRVKIPYLVTGHGSTRVGG